MKKILEKLKKRDYTKQMDEIYAKNDIFFRYTFSRPENAGILLQFVNDVFADSNSQKITSVKVLNPFNLKEEKIGKESVLDLKAETEDGKLINIEMQLYGNENFIKRSLYYWAKAYSGQIKEKEIYKTLHPVICINILDFMLPTTKDKIHTCFYLHEKTDSNMVLTEDCEIHFIEMPKFFAKSQKLSKPLSTWIEYFAKKREGGEDMEYVIQKNPALRTVDNDFKKFTGNDTYRNYYEEQLKIWRDKEYLLDIARTEATKKALEQGITQGLQQGIQQGAQQKALETAKKMKEKGFSHADIYALTGVAHAEIDTL